MKLNNLKVSDIGKNCFKYKVGDLDIFNLFGFDCVLRIGNFFLIDFALVGFEFKRHLSNREMQFSDSSCRANFPFIIFK